MANQSEKKERKPSKQTLIKQDLLDQLDRKGLYGNYYLDLIDDYMQLWAIKNKLLKDAKKNPYTEWRNSEPSYGRKKNDSTDQAVKVNQQMLKILTFLGIKPSEHDDIDYDDLEM